MGATTDHSAATRAQDWTLVLRLLEFTIHIDGPTTLQGELAKCFEDTSWLRPEHAGPADLSIRVAPRRFWSDPSIAISISPVGEIPELRPLVLPRPPQMASILTRWAVEKSTSYHSFHAAAVSTGSGAVVLPGPSGAGKSTLTLGLIKRGLQFLSDEVAAHDLISGNIVPFARRLCLRLDTLAMLGSISTAHCGRDEDAVFLPMAAVGGVRASVAVPPRIIVVPDFGGASGTSLAHLSPTEVLTTLLQASCSRMRHKIAGLDFVLSLAQAVPAYRLGFQSLEPALDAIEGLIGL